jgi:putative phosphoesterase
LTSDEARVGLISDTHGLLRSDVHQAFEGVSLILHAGDVGAGLILEELGAIAPVFAVRGNTDMPDDPALRDSIDTVEAGFRIHVSHGHEVGVPTPEKLLLLYDSDIIVYGHTHRQLLHREGNRMVINPGAAGPRRFDVRPSVAVLTLTPGNALAEFVELVG